MNWKKERLKNFKLYAITDLKEEDPEILAKITGALHGGVDIIQLRSKTLPDKILLSLGKKIRGVTQKLKKLFVVNDRVDLMLALDADGVHLGQEDLPIQVARRMIGGRDKMIGCSTHSLEQAIDAQHEGADYIGFGPIFETPTKPTYQPVGLDVISEVMKRIRIPVVCIGGIAPSNIEKVVQAGARRVAVVRAIFSVDDPYRAASELNVILRRSRRLVERRTVGPAKDLCHRSFTSFKMTEK